LQACGAITDQTACDANAQLYGDVLPLGDGSGNVQVQKERLFGAV
jgi:hypothetical protein